MEKKDAKTTAGSTEGKESSSSDSVPNATGKFVTTYKYYGRTDAYNHDTTDELEITPDGKILVPDYSPGYDMDNFCGSDECTWKYDAETKKVEFKGPLKVSMPNIDTVVVAFSSNCKITYKRK